MEQPRFPLYRRSANALNWYRIESATALVEVQRIGSRYVVHRLAAVAYPEQVRIRSLIDLEDGHVQACAAEEVESLLAEVE
ncbi:MAG: hypothetical protein KBH07_08305 [Flavobacteriales bacterium]|nr:hypothetical protein [Flavobacteriales bacterium]MBP9080433.1 hypothetical protein [Flavobacteriales bacterium]